MIAATTLGIVFVPLFFVACMRFARKAVAPETRHA